MHFHAAQAADVLTRAEQLRIAELRSYQTHEGLLEVEQFMREYFRHTNPVSHIAERFNPEEIILFGSHAYGKPDGWSDVDLLVVMDTPEGEMETSLEISESLPALSFSVDIIVRSRSVLEKRKKMGDWFLREVTQKGKVLYARTNQ